MNILFLGEIVGRPGRTVIRNNLKKIINQRRIDWVIANGENLAHGKGITEDTYQQMIQAGIDLFTTGNHLWGQKEIKNILSNPEIKILRPANYPEGVPGQGWQKLTKNKSHLIVISLMGRAFMDTTLDCPFRKADEILKKVGRSAPIFIDFHAEATAEKQAFGHYLDGRVGAVIGTHTHIPTCDAKILPNGTAYQTDVGMIGPLDSVLGVKKEQSIERHLYGIPVTFEVASGPVVFNATLIKINPQTKLAQKIEHIQKIFE